VRYMHMKGWRKDKVLSELNAGDDVLIVNSMGETDCRDWKSKDRAPPAMLVEAEVDGIKIKTLLQNAETIKLVGATGSLSCYSA